MRIDKWLFFARIFKTRNRAVKGIEKGLVFVNGKLVLKQSQLIKIGDGIIIKGSKEILQLKIMKFGARRESYDTARHMYENIVQEILEDGEGNHDQATPELKQKIRPDKKDRRALIKLKRVNNFLTE